MISRLALALLGPVVLLALVLAVNTLRRGSRQLDVPPAAGLAIDEDRATTPRASSST